MKPRPLFVANWKMNLTGKQANGFLAEFGSLLSKSDVASADIAIAPSFTVIAQIADCIAKKQLLLGAQNVHWEISGAHTGEVSVSMLKELGVSFVIIGHSERRQFYGETDETVAKRLKTTIAAGLFAILCVGESKEQFEQGQTNNVVTSQLLSAIKDLEPNAIDRLVIAYEPVWAIGTGLAATPEIASAVHSHIRSQLLAHFGQGALQIKILYGGSTTPGNIAAMMSSCDINGALVGGASLKPDIFNQLISLGNSAYVSAP